jgi:hypothetical protein
LFWLEIPVQSWIGMGIVDTLVSFLILGENGFSF